ncbi:hypothetical protein ACFPRL_34180 [Pseudoclavibacter helvolus]
MLTQLNGVVEVFLFSLLRQQPVPLSVCECRTVVLDGQVHTPRAPTNEFLQSEQRLQLKFVSFVFEHSQTVAGRGLFRARILCLQLLPLSSCGDSETAERAQQSPCGSDYGR